MAGELGEQTFGRVGDKADPKMKNAPGWRLTPGFVGP